MDTTALILAEIHRAIERLGGSQRPATPEQASRIVCELSADVDLRSICGSWEEPTLEDDEILAMLRNWNAGVPVFTEVYASREEPSPKN
jgi:hypothetical protein